MTDKNAFDPFKDEAHSFDLPDGGRMTAIPLGGGSGKGGALGALLAAALLGGLPPPGAKDDGKHDDHPLLKKLGVEPPQPFRAATKEEFLAFFGDGWPKLEVGDIVEVRDGFALDAWPTKGEQAIVSQVLSNPIRRGQPYTEQMGRLNDVALIFVQNTDAEVAAAFAEVGKPQKPAALFEFLYDSRRLKKVGNVFE